MNSLHPKIYFYQPSYFHSFKHWKFYWTDWYIVKAFYIDKWKTICQMKALGLYSALHQGICLKQKQKQQNSGVDENRDSCHHFPIFTQLGNPALIKNWIFFEQRRCGGRKVGCDTGLGLAIRQIGVHVIFCHGAQRFPWFPPDCSRWPPDPICEPTNGARNEAKTVAPHWLGQNLLMPSGWRCHSKKM